MSADRVDNTETDEDGGGGDGEYEIKALRKTGGSGGKGRDNVATYENNKKRLWFLKGYYIQ